LRILGAAASTVVVAPLAACDPREYARRKGAKQRLSVAAGNAGGVHYAYGGGLAQLISTHVPNVEATAEVTGGSADNLKLVARAQADLAFTLADTLYEAYNGTGAFAKFGKVPARALAVLYVNYTHVVTWADSGVNAIADLRDKVVSTGAPGSGTELIALRILEAAGLDPTSNVRRQALGAGPSGDALKDGKIDAFFWSAGVPSGVISDLASTPGRSLRLLPSAGLLPRLQERSGAPLYTAVTIPRGAYRGLETDVPVVGVSSVLAVDESMNASLAYEITRALFDWRAELVAIHSEARKLTPESAVAGSPVPFHEGALRFYRERRVWPS
jgi:hypothetical protein